MACAALNNVPVNVYSVGVRASGSFYTGSSRSLILRSGPFGLQVFAPDGTSIPVMTFDPIVLRGGNIQR
jgi:hypothetical protein